ncbi:hypothetical protein B0J17DRAFT_659876 [Rhizoctonia solani]|nr:hypothetical protein B0J17DRAFT_659876 [Rhizoctonia solani]
MEQHQLKLFRRVVEIAAEPSFQGQEQSGNPFIYIMEALSSHEISLLEKPHGDYQLLYEMPPDHPDSIVLDANNEAKREKRLLPVVPLLVNRDTIVEHYRLLYDISPDNLTSNDNSSIRQTIMTQAPNFVRTPLESLMPISISSLILNQVHQGSYLIVRAISHTVRLVAVQVAAEDQEGSVIDLALYHCFELSGLDREGILELIPPGQALLIRDPWVARGLTGGHVTVRVDSPSDIVLLPPNHPLLAQYPEIWRSGHDTDAQAYKEMGNNAFKNGRFESAIRAYTFGLSVDPNFSLLRLNRSLCYLNTKRLSNALNDARAASKDASMTQALVSKAYYRMALAYYAMDRFTDALAILDGNARKPFSPSDFAALKQKTHQRILEQTQGSYNWFTLEKAAKQINGRHPIPDVADYVGPIKVAQRSTKDGSRGLITTRNVLAGELLIVSKPFAIASSQEFPELFRVLRTTTGGIVERANYELIGRTMRRLEGDFTAASALFLDIHSNGLHSDVPPLAEGSPTFLANGGRHWDIPGEYPNGHIDLNLIEGILGSNTFSDPIMGSSFGRNEAVYLLPSMINHSCHGTALRTSVGSISVMRASRNMKSGEEITCSFIGGAEGPSLVSRKAALKTWLIACSCELCLADQRDGETRCNDREGYQKELNGLRMRLRPADLELAKVAKDLLVKIRSTYDHKRTAPMDTLGLSQRVAAFTQQLINPAQAIKFYTDALRSHGIHVKYDPPKKVPQSRSQLRKESLIISTSTFPSQRDTIFRCIKVMATLANLEIQQGNNLLASHWAVACLWVHEAFYGLGKDFLWYSLDIHRDTQHPLVIMLHGFD